VPLTRTSRRGDRRHQRRARCRAARFPTLNESALPGYVAVGWKGWSDRRDPRAGPREDPHRGGEDLRTADMRERLISWRRSRQSRRRGIHHARQVGDVKWAKAVKDSARSSTDRNPAMSATAPITAQVTAPTAELARFIAISNTISFPPRCASASRTSSSTRSRARSRTPRRREPADPRTRYRARRLARGERHRRRAALARRRHAADGYLITAVTVCDVHRPTLCHTTPRSFRPPWRSPSATARAAAR